MLYIALFLLLHLSVRRCWLSHPSMLPNSGKNWFYNMYYVPANSGAAFLILLISQIMNEE